MSEFVKNFKTLIDCEGITLSDIHKATGISKAQLGKYFAGSYEPSITNLVKICDYFNCSLDYILGLTIDEKLYFKSQPQNAELFIKRYYELLKINNTSHAEVCRKANCNRNNLVYWKHNKTFPTLEILRKFAEILNVSIDYLIGRSDDR